MTSKNIMLIDTSSSSGNYHGSATGDSLSRANSTNNILDPASTKQKVLPYHLVGTHVDLHLNSGVEICKLNKLTPNLQ